MQTIRIIFLYMYLRYAFTHLSTHLSTRVRYLFNSTDTTVNEVNNVTYKKIKKISNKCHL